VFIYVCSVRGHNGHRCDINENMSLSISLMENPAPVPRLKKSDIRTVDHSNLPSFMINGNLLLSCTLNDIYVHSTFTNVYALNLMLIFIFQFDFYKFIIIPFIMSVC